MQGSARGRRRTVPFAALAVGLVAYAHDAVFSRLAPADPAVVAAGRFAAAGLALWPILLIRAPGTLARVGLPTLAVGALAGTLLAVSFTAWIAATQLTSLANSLILAHLTPVWVILLAFWCLGRRPRAPDLLAVALSVAGVGVITRGTVLGESGGGLAGDLAAAASSVPSAAFLVLTAAVATRLPMLLCTTLAWTWAALLLSAWSVLRGAALPTDATVLAAILGMGLCAQFVGHGLITLSLARLSPCFVAVCCLGEPLLGGFLAWAYFAEAPGWSTAAGGALILGAICLGARGEAAAEPVAGARDLTLPARV